MAEMSSAHMPEQTSITPPIITDKLPAELLCAVIALIPRPSDLKALCLTSKALRKVATPALFRDVVLDDKTPHWPNLMIGRGLLSARNPDLAHVRSLGCRSSSNIRTPETEGLELQSIQMVLFSRGTLSVRCKDVTTSTLENRSQSEGTFPIQHLI